MPPYLMGVHGLNSTPENDPYLRFARNHTDRCFVYAHHLAQHSGFRSIMPLLYGSTEPSRLEANIFCITNHLHLEGRDYQGLLAASEHLKKQGASFVIKHTGNSRRNDGQLFRQMITKRFLQDHFVFYDKEMSHVEFFEDIRTSSFMLPLIDPNQMTTAEAQAHARRYYKHGLASAIAIGVGMGKPLIIEEELANIYGIADVAITYPTGQLTYGIQKAVDLPTEQRLNLSRRILALRQSWRDQSIQNLKKMLNTEPLTH